MSWTIYAQVMDELQSGAVTRTYSYGLELINERQSIAGTPTTSFYGFDGHGSVRFLTDSTGAITDAYDYDAFGNLLSSTGTTPNNYLFAGEQFDPATGTYYNRARYYDQRQGRFWSMDTVEGASRDPQSLHKYLYSRDGPVNRVDPSGNMDLADVALASAITTVLANITITGLSLTAPNGKRGGNVTPSGLIVSARVGLAYDAAYAGAGVDLLRDSSSGNFYYAPTAEGGTAPISIFNGFKGPNYAFTAGFAYYDSVQDLRGLSFAAVWPSKFVGTLLRLLPGTGEAFGTLTAIANSTRNNLSFSNFAFVFGYSPSGASFFQFGPRSNAFSTLGSYSGDFRRVTPDIQTAFGWVIDKVATAIGPEMDPQNLPEAVESLNPE